MKLSKHLACVSALVFSLLFQAKQTAALVSDERTLDISSLQLSSIESDHFTAFSHPAFPGRSARIKKSNFCDGRVASYTGYIDIGPKHFFFYFFESRSEPDKDDVLFWTNGGPGGSSATGLFLELGPCLIASANSTRYNPYSWNSNANIFFIDQPIGTGFSYYDLGEIPSSSEDSSVDIAAFVALFFETFDSFKGRNFHLTGESYAGRMLPVYAAAIYDQNALLVAKGYEPINLKSVMIGNGATDWFTLTHSYYELQCTGVGLGPLQPISTCIRLKQILPRCIQKQKEACIDHFDLIDCTAAFSVCGELFFPYTDAGFNYYDMSRKCNTDTECYPQQKDIKAFLNTPSVLEVLGVDPGRNYTQLAVDIKKAFWSHGDHLHQTQLYIAELLARGVKILIYAGSYDFIANWRGNEQWTLEMEWAGREFFSRTPLTEWEIDGIPAGKTRSYGNFSFATIYGGGHLAPHDKPAESLMLLQRWLADEPF